MGDILSQAEIDSLLSALSRGEITAEPEKEEVRKVKTYDFLHPDRFSKDQTRALQMLHEHFARLFSTSLSAFLRSLVDVALVSVDQLSYDEFIRSVPNPTCINIINARPLSGQAIIEISPALSFAIVDRLMGGRGQEFSKNRELTEIEQVLIERILSRAFDCMQEAWAGVYKLSFSLETTDTNPQLFMQLFLPSEMVILTTLEISLGDSVGTMSICFPYVVLEPIAQLLSARSWFTSGRKPVDSPDRQVLQDRLKRVEMPVVAYLGEASVKVSELLRLSVGDVIITRTGRDRPAWVLVGDEVKYQGVPGTVRGKRAVRITRIIKPGDIV